MAVEVTQNLTQVTISSVGVQGPKGDVGDSGLTQDVGGLASTASLNQFTSSYLTDSASFANRLNNATNEQDLSTYLSASVFNNKTGSFATTSSFNSFTSSYLTDSASFANRLNNATNEQDLSTYLSASVFNNKTGSFATTGSNTFVGNQTISGSIYLENDRAINFGTNNTYVGMGEGALLLRDSTGYIQLDAQNPTNYAQIILNADNEDFFYVNHNTTDNTLKFTTSGSLLINEIAYDAHLATTGSNTFNGNQTINGTITLDNNSVIKDNANQSISFGVDAAESGQGTQSTAIGSNAGQTDQGNGATALGALAGNLEQGQSAVAIGALAGSTQQGDWAIAIGTQAGGINQGNYSIALGNLAGGLNQAANSVVINATGTQLDNTTASSLKIAPIRINDDGSKNVLVYNTTTKEVSYSADKFATTGSNTFYGTQSVTGSVRISGSIDDISYIDFDTVAPSTAVARLGWDDGEGTLTIGLSGGNVNIPIGVTSFETAFNADSSSISKGDVVRISGAQGNRVAIQKANNLNDDGSATTVALAAETIGVGAQGKVILSGPLKGIDTTAFAEGDLLYLSSTPGGITNIKPQAPLHEVRIGVAQRIHASVGIINVKVDNGYELDELHNVRITTASLAHNQLLAYSGSVWRNETIGGLGIAETASLNPVLAYTASLKAVSIVSSSTQIQNYNVFARTGSANTFYGNQTITGSLDVTGSLSLRGKLSIESRNENVFVGLNAGRDSQPDFLTRYNTALGTDALRSLTDGEYNTAIGSNAMWPATQLDLNVAVGYTAGTSLGNGSTNNILLGTGAGPDLTTTISDRLYINNKGSDTPLIYGEFTDTPFVTINGGLNVTGSVRIDGTGSLNGDNIVSSNTIQKIETISSASYAALNPPVSGTLYIII